MKKLFTIFIIAAVLCITGCKQASTTDDNNLTKTIKISKDGEVYLIKLNTTEKTCYEDDTGYVKKVARSAVEENNLDTDFSVRCMNEKISKALLNEPASRSAASNTQTGTNNLDSINTGDTQKFYSITGQQNDKQYGTINISSELDATCKYKGTHCLVYADNNNAKLLNHNGDYISDEVYVTLGQKFDACYEEVIKIIGNPVYGKYNADYFVPCTTKITIFVSDLFGDAQENQETGTVGYFYSADLFDQSYLDNSSMFNKGLTKTSPYYIHTNQREMFYIDTVFLKEMPKIVYSTLVHEFNHMINFVIKTLNYMTDNTKDLAYAQACDTWFTEMLAMTTEDMFQKYLDLDDEHSPKARLSTFGFNYCYGFKNWNNQNVDQLSMYANTYAFGAFLARNFGGIELIKEIAQSSYVDEQAITKAIQKLNPGKTYTDEVTEETKPWDFTFALRKFPLCVIYTDYGYEWSLNNKTGFTNGSKIGFSEINLKQRVAVNGQEYQLPVYFYSDKKGCVNILAKGFTVHHVGTNITSFTLTVPKTSKLEYYYVIK